MALDEYWNGDPELVLTYFQAELFRVRRKQRDMWYEGLYLQRAIVSCFDEDTKYFDAPLPDTVVDREKMVEKQQEDSQSLLEARMLAWGKTGG